MAQCQITLLGDDGSEVSSEADIAPYAQKPVAVAFVSRLEMRRAINVQRVRVTFQDGRELIHTLKQAIDLNPKDWVDIKFTYPTSPDVSGEQGCQLKVWARDTPLICAARDGDEAGVERLLAEGADPTVTGRYGHSPLYVGAKGGHFGVVKRLLQAGADVYARGYAIPLHEAASQGHIEVVRLLLSSGADPNLGGSHGQTAVDLAAGSGRLEVVRVLLEAGARGGDSTGGFGDMMGETALHNAVEGGNREVVELLLQHGWLVNAKRHVMRRNHNAQTPLDIALSSGREDLATCLRASGGMTASEAYLNWFGRGGGGEQQ
jgi:hypothetical protein